MLYITKHVKDRFAERMGEYRSSETSTFSDDILELINGEKSKVISRWYDTYYIDIDDIWRFVIKPTGYAGRYSLVTCYNILEECVQ